MLSSNEILEQDTIRSEQDIFRLNFIDWQRLNGYWPNPQAAMHTLGSWFIDTTRYYRVKVDLRQYPERDDWPGWNHIGAHPEMGRLYWNFFYSQYDLDQASITFSDSPDFFGTISLPPKPVFRFWGDIGKVSPSALAEVQKQMDAHDVWISVLSETTQLLIEPFVSLTTLWEARRYKAPSEHC